MKSGLEKLYVSSIFSSIVPIFYPKFISILFNVSLLTYNVIFLGCI